MAFTLLNHISHSLRVRPARCLVRHIDRLITALSLGTASFSQMLSSTCLPLVDGYGHVVLMMRDKMVLHHKVSTDKDDYIVSFKKKDI